MSNLLNLNSAYDTQIAFSKKVKFLRKSKKWSRRQLSEITGVPAPTIKNFEYTGQISFRQFLLLWEKLSSIDEFYSLTQTNEQSPKTVEDVLNAQ